jgi:hypothetical protein
MSISLNDIEKDINNPSLLSIEDYLTSDCFNESGSMEDTGMHFSCQVIHRRRAAET